MNVVSGWAALRCMGGLRISGLVCLVGCILSLPPPSLHYLPPPLFLSPPTDLPLSPTLFLLLYLPPPCPPRHSLSLSCLKSKTRYYPNTMRIKVFEFEFSLSLSVSLSVSPSLSLSLSVSVSVSLSLSFCLSVWD